MNFRFDFAKIITFFRNKTKKIPFPVTFRPLAKILTKLKIINYLQKNNVSLKNFRIFVRFY